MIPKPAFNYFTGKSHIIYKALTGKAFQLKLAEIPKIKQVPNKTESVKKDKTAFEINNELKKLELEN